MKTKSCVLLTVFIAILARGQGTFFYDQQSVISDNAGSGPDSPIQSNQPIGQSFTPSLSSVGFIAVWLRDENPGNSLGAAVYLNILANSITGNVIASSSPVSMADGYGLAGYGYSSGVTYFLFSTPVSVTPGTTYYFQPVIESGGDTWGISGYNFAYSGGTAFFDGIANSSEDLWFREGIVVPEPSPPWLVLLGSGALWFWRQRKFL